jgi:uncharacterized Tic20 family protein
MENDAAEPTEPSIEAETQQPHVLPSTEVKADHTIGMLCHLLSLTLLLGVPLANILVPLSVWPIKRDEDPFVDLCGKESLNFQISMTIYMVIAGFLILLFVGLFMIPILMILNIVYTIIAAIKASQGTSYTYPLTIRFIK